MESMMWKGIAMITLIISFVALIIGIVGVDKATILLSSEKAAAVAVDNGFPKSCKDIKGSSGLYTIQPDLSVPSFQVFCDQDVSGGGWTLVATVHENNIDGKCTSGDKWSSQQGSSNSGGSRNWENQNTFGQLETVTDQDYKNPAYYAVPARDLMIWHVPNGKKVHELSDSAFLKYYTDSGFLNTTNLQYLYKERFPLQTANSGLDDLLAKYQNSSLNASITNDIPFWYSYRYDGGTAATSIRDGGRDMYDGGNQVFFGTERENFTLMRYNTPYFLYGSGFEVKSSATKYPFVTLAWIGSGISAQQSGVEYFDLRVKSNYGADGRGNSLVYDTTLIEQGDMKAKYTAFLVANASDPSVCEVFFYISSRSWKSKAPREVIRRGWRNSTREATNTVRFTGRPTNVLVGYTLLSKLNGRTIYQSEIERVLRRFMDLSRGFNFNVAVRSHVQKVKFAKGSADDIKKSTPRLQVEKAEYGYVQFRAFNLVGLPNALCPGVNVQRADHAEQMCIGGASTGLREISQCGDFAGWKGVSGDPGSQNAPSDTGKSLNDITSSILIFTR